MKPQEIYAEIATENSAVIDLDGSKYISLGYENSLVAIEEFVEYVMNNDFVIVKSDVDKRDRPILSLSEYVRKCIAQFGYWMKTYDQRYVYSENVELFFDSFATMGIDHTDFRRNKTICQGQLVSSPELFDKFVKNIRSGKASRAFRQKVAKRNQNYKRSHASLIGYVERLFSLHARIMTLRIDLGFKAEMIDELTLEFVHRERERLLNNVRGNKIFESMVGYIWKLEFGTKKGYHFHFIFFFDGSKVKKDEYKAHQIGTYWDSEVTRGIGVHYNCNRDKSNYKRCGIGMINHYDAEMRSNLLLAVKYLAKKEQYLRARLKTRMRLFGKGELPQHRPTRPGRPRRNSAGLSSLHVNDSPASRCPSLPLPSSP